MTTAPVNTTAPNVHPTKRKELKTEDFIKMMITQLQHQDPMEPAKNQELLAQMSQIGQLQSNTSMQETLKGITLQNQIGSAGNMIGKVVQGLDESNEEVEGLVTSVRIEEQRVYLELDNGRTLPMDRVTEVAGASAGSDTGAPASKAVKAPGGGVKITKD
jgi:flagellar basal-body rod modification protein FlgD